MKQAIVAVEDKRFYEHNGVDVRGYPRRLGGHSEQVRRRGRLHDHAAVRQERVQPQRPDDRAQGARGGARLAAHPAGRGPDPDRLPQHDLLRQRRLRDPPGRRTYFQGKSAEELTLPEGSPAGGDPRQPGALRPGAAPRRCPTAARGRPRSAPRAGVGSPPPSGARRTRPRCPSPRMSVARDAGAGAVLRQLRHRPARRAVPRRARVRRRARGDDDDRPRPQEKAREAIEVLRNPDGPVAALVAIDPRTGAVKAMFGGTNFGAASSILRRRRSASPGRPSSRSCSQPRSARASLQGTRITSKPIEIVAGDESGP